MVVVVTHGLHQPAAGPLVRGSRCLNIGFRMMIVARRRLHRPAADPLMCDYGTTAASFLVQEFAREAWGT
eukprot:scaffold218076_cov23-Tisochrysis_lutea.AAC.2